ncbi:copper chaperone PCu(A)C [Sedimentitalea sp. HM32M-2]|uniref:copper chaperone PCu(A)C n=1 Tax=Sedimentitalea sp. HM32M-2 TaxID=3351566 RepID=UPI00364260E5
MKAVKPTAALGILVLIAVAIFLLVLRTQQGDVRVSKINAAPLRDAKGSVGVFLTLHNSGDADRLVAVRSIVARRARLDGSVADAGLAMPGPSRTELAPDGAHIVLEGVGGALVPGRMIPITLRFQHADELRIQAPLGEPISRAAAGQAGLGAPLAQTEGPPTPDITLQVQPDGVGWIVQVTTAGFTFSEEDEMTEHVPGTGYGILYLGGLRLQRLHQPGARIGALPPGRHEIRVTLHTNDHRVYLVDGQPVTATAEIIVH